MHIPNLKNTVELLFDTSSNVYSRDIDSESEWELNMQFSEQSHHKKSRNPSIDNFSLIEPQFNNIDDFEHQLGQLESMFEARERCQRLQTSLKRFKYEEDNFPAHINFGFSFTPSYGLYKRNNLNDEKYNDNEVETFKMVKEITVANSVASEYEKCAHSHTKPFSADDVSAKSVHSDCSTLKFNNRAFVEGSKKKDNSKYQNVHALHQVLRKYFKGHTISRKEVDLLPHEMTILRSIINRKYKNKIHFSDDPFFLNEKINELHDRCSSKRSEECYKFIFKRCIKYMRDDFKFTKARKSPKCELETKFYESYFGEIASKENICLQSFYQPTNSLKKCKGMPKTINAEYMHNICKSQDFVSRFLDYAYNHLRYDYEHVIDAKIECLIKKWDEMLESTDSEKNDVAEDITRYIEKNRKCKLPWSLVEVDDALVALRKLFKEYGYDGETLVVNDK